MRAANPRMTARGPFRLEGVQTAPLGLCDGFLGGGLEEIERSSTHVLVWYATGCGWQSQSSAPSASVEGMLAVLQRMPPARRPQILVLVLEYGARRAAELASRAVPFKVSILSISICALYSLRNSQNNVADTQK